MMAVEYLVRVVGMENSIGMEKCEVVFGVHSVRGKMLEACVVLEMHHGMMEVAFVVVVVVVECWESFGALHILWFEALLFEMRRNVG